MDNRAWYQMDGQEVLSILGSDGQKGLSTKEAEMRLLDVGPNMLVESKKKSPLAIFVAQFKDFMVMVLLAATAVSGLLGEVADAVTILAIVVINGVLGFIQEFKAEKSLESLKQMTAPEARVIRGGHEERVPAATVVPGDVVVLETGDRVPADVRLLQATNMEVEESILTGESKPVAKHAKTLEQGNLSLGDRRNMLYMGTAITRGRGFGVTVGTGMHTEMGQIAGLMESVVEEETPLQRRLDQLGRWLVVLCLSICAVVVLTGVVRGEPLYQMFLTGVSLAVAAIPEGLPAIVTVALAIGVQRMIRRRAIVRKLPAVETLGCATIICSDKTGTLTRNEMTVRELLCGDERIAVSGQGYEPRGEFVSLTGVERPVSNLNLLLTAMVACNNAHLRREGIGAGGLFRRNRQDIWSIQGDPTEGALLVAAAKGGIWREGVEKTIPRLIEHPFDSDRKRMSTVCRLDNQNMRVFVKGALDMVLERCQSIYRHGRLEPLTPSHRRLVLEVNESMALKALRVLAVAYRDLPAGVDLTDPEAVEKDLTFLGMAGMIDPPRPAAVQAVKVCQEAGIRVAMITGDHPTTARAIARELGLPSGEKQLLTGTDLDAMDDDALARVVEDISVFARVSPKHKLLIVRALKARGHVVAMTGDGVNDAPAIKEADIGVAMGLTGTDVTKEASAMVLGDDNFATIVAAVEEGRGIYDNIRKFIRYLLSCNVGEVLTMFVAALAGLPLPLLPIQILWVNLVTDGLPAMALGVDNPDPDIMRRKPRHPRESVFSRGLARKIISRGLYIGLGTPLVFVIALYLGDNNLTVARTMAFTTLVFSQLFHVFDCKSEHHSVFEVGLFSNPFLVGAVLCSVTMQLSVLYVPVLQDIFHTTGLNGFQWAIILAVAGGKTFVTGIHHFLIRRLFRRLVYIRA